MCLLQGLLLNSPDVEWSMIGSANHAAQRNIASCLPAKSIPKEKKVRWLNQERMTLIIVPIIAPPSPRGWVSHLK